MIDQRLPNAAEMLGKSTKQAGVYTTSGFATALATLPSALEWRSVAVRRLASGESRLMTKGNWNGTTSY
jgi:hypothetical protein